MNKLYCGDCLAIMQEMRAESIDLIYLDPPFNSNRDYGSFKDIWSLGDILPEWIEQIEQSNKALWGFITLSGSISGESTQAYLTYMAIRLIEMRRILKPTGTIYLHCDPTASHYIKVMMDGIFGHQNFRNEIIWCYKRMASRNQKHFSKCHDILLCYGKSQHCTFNADAVRLPYAESSLKRAGYRKTSLGGGAPKSEICELNTKGRFPEDWWDIPFLRPNAKERLGYATQKPLSLLDRIIKASSNEGDVVFDPFCGCATTLEAAHSLNRRWIGIDIAIHAIKRVASVRLNERCHLQAGVDYEIHDITRTNERNHNAD